MMDSSNDFVDPFDYKPLLRKKKVKQLTSQKCTSTQPKRATQQRKSPAKKSQKSPSKIVRKSPAKKPQKSPAKKSPPGKNNSQNNSPSKQLSLDSFWNKNTQLVNNNESDHYCPMCQVPFNILGDRSRQEHAEMCVMLSDCASECKEGLSCQSKYASHFTQFKHILLAHHRAIGAFTRTTQILENSSISDFDSNRGKFPPLEREIIAPTPVHNSTLISRPLSPIKKVGNFKNICVTSEDDSPPAAAERSNAVVDRSLAAGDRIESEGNSMAVERSKVTGDKSVGGGRKLSSSHVDQFLQGLDNDKNVPENENSPEILRGMEKTPRRRKSVSGESQVAGPSNQQLHNPTGKPGNVQLQTNSSSSPGTGSQQEQGTSKQDRPSDSQHEGDGNKDIDTESGDPGQGSQIGKKSCDNGRDMRSPFQVRCKRGSEEFELSLQVEKDTRKVAVKIPMNRDPVEVTTRYRGSSSSGGSSTSPSKQSKITSFIGNNTPQSAVINKKNNFLSSASDTDSSPGEYVYAKKAKFDSAISQWNKIFKKPAVPAPGKTPSGRPQKGFFGQSSDDRHELKRKVPHFKKIRGTSFAVDAFNYGEIPGVLKYFLSHYHYDHFQGITKHWKKPIVCSSLTKRFLVHYQKVNPGLITTIDPDEERMVDQTQVSCVEANHCPGAVMFIFKLTTGDTILHVGDFRADHSMEENNLFWNNRIYDLVYLDTTYCNPSYDFPSQQKVIEFSQRKALEMAEKHKKLVILVGGYTIGKERIFKGIAEALDCKVWANTKRRGTWKLLEDEVINKRATDHRSKAQVQVIDQKKLCWNGLKEEAKELTPYFSHILGIKPTGWTHEKGSDKVDLEGIKVKTSGNISFLEVPYSEHSSFSELKRFIQFLRIKNTRQIIPTVNLRDYKQMNEYFDDWIKEAAAKGPDSQ